MMRVTYAVHVRSKLGYQIADNILWRSSQKKHEQHIIYRLTTYHDNMILQNFRLPSSLQ
jgi:hypothetical protein